MQSQPLYRSNFAIRSFFESFRWLILHKRELTRHFFNFVLAMQGVPLLFDVQLLRFLGFGLLLRLGGNLLELVAVDLHVRPDQLVCYRGHCLVPVLILLGYQEPLNNDRIALLHTGLDQFLDHIRVQEEQRLLRCLVVHPLRRQYQSPEQVRPKLPKLLLALAAHHLDHLLNLVDEDDFFGWAGQRPKL